MVNCCRQGIVMKNRAIAVFVASALVIPAAAAPKSTANYPETFYVRYSALDENATLGLGGCTMVVSERNVEYRLMDSGLLSSVCFNVGQSLQGRLKGNRVEILYTDSKGKQKTVKYQIVSQQVF